MGDQPIFLSSLIHLFYPKTLDMMVPLPEYINFVIKKGLINELCKSEINKLIDFVEKVLFFFSF